jgi:hypothetical protein
VAVLPLQFPELVETCTLLYVPATGLVQLNVAGVQVRPVVTADDELLLPVQVTTGGVIAVPAVPDAGTLAQVSVYVTGAGATVKVPPQVAVLPLQFPELADTDTLLYVPAAGLVQFNVVGVQVRPVATAVPLQVTAGGVIAVPAVPDAGTLAQASVYVITLLLLGATELLLGATELLLGAALELLGTALMVILLQLPLTLVAPVPQFAVTPIST